MSVPEHDAHWAAEVQLPRRRSAVKTPTARSNGSTRPETLRANLFRNRSPALSEGRRRGDVTGEQPTQSPANMARAMVRVLFIEAFSASHDTASWLEPG